MAVHRRRRGGTPPPRPNEIYHWKNLVGPFLVHKFLVPDPPLSTPGPQPFRGPSSSSSPPPASCGDLQDCDEITLAPSQARTPCGASTVGPTPRSLYENHITVSCWPNFATLALQSPNSSQLHSEFTSMSEIPASAALTPSQASLLSGNRLSSFKRYVDADTGQVYMSNSKYVFVVDRTQTNSQESLGALASPVCTQPTPRSRRTVSDDADRSRRALCLLMFRLLGTDGM